jgi:hypothetical protein
MNRLTCDDTETNTGILNTGSYFKESMAPTFFTNSSVSNSLTAIFIAEIPNEMTEKVISLAEEGSDLASFPTAEDLFEDLEN